MNIADAISKHLKHVHYKNSFGILCEPISNKEVTGIFLSIYSCPEVSLQGTDFDYFEQIDCDTISTSTCTSSILVLNPTIQCTASIDVL